MKLRSVAFETKREGMGYSLDYELSVILYVTSPSFITVKTRDAEHVVTEYDYEFHHEIDTAVLQSNHPQVRVADWQLIERQYNKLHGEE